MDNTKVRLSLEVPVELNRVLEQIANESGGTKSEVLRKALALMNVAHKAGRDGKRVGIAALDSRLETEFVGL
jgi:predicted transcriptional regulator